MTNRRDFIKTSTRIAAGSLILPSMAYAANSGKTKISTKPTGEMEVGIQIYSVRNQLKEDFKGTIAKVSKIGYKLVEGYGLGTDGLFLGKYSPAEYKQAFSGQGMNLVATHSSYFTAAEAPKMIDAAKTAGVEYLVIPYTPGDLRETLDGYKAVAANFNAIGEQCKAAGLKFGYHNHAFEFDMMEGRVPLEVLIEETDKSLVDFEADLFWVNKGGYNPVKLIKKYPGRISMFHVKDATKETDEATVGEGVINFKSIFKAGKKDALKYYFIEDERTDDPFGNIKADFNYIAAQKFA